MEQQVPRNMFPHRTKVDPLTKLCISLVVALLWAFMTRFDPPLAHLSHNFTYVDSTLEHIFETTIAIETKRFTKRIIQHTQGVWKLIPYVNQPRWIDLQISLTTRIGFNLKHGNAKINEEGRVEVSVFEPTVLDKTWSTEIVDKGEGFMNKWDIQEYKQKENQVLEAIAHAESMHLLEEFKNSPDKMGELSRRLEHKLGHQNSGTVEYLRDWLGGVNAAVKNKVKDLLGGGSVRAEPSVHDQRASFVHNEREQREYYQEDSQDKQQQKRQARKAVVVSDSQGQRGRQGRVHYTEEQLKIRSQMRAALNL